jgi:hypothetical protein
MTAGAPRAAQTEAKFLEQDHVKNSAANSSIIPEWRAARGDHKIIAYTIANCQKVRDQFGGIDTMPRGVFTALLLDLTPLGDHKFSSEQFASEASAADDGNDPGTAVADADAGATPSSVVPPIIKRDKSIELTDYQQTMLFLSDAIARARLTAASEANNNLPNMRLFGWITIGVSAIATLLVTVKASMSPPPADAKGRRRMYAGIGIAAMLVSATGTALTSAKQFYDPQRTYKSSEAALLELRKLHNQVAFEFVRTWDGAQCALRGNEDPQFRVKDWSQRLATVQAAVIMASANLQDADLIKPDQPTRDQPPLRDAAGATASVR